MIYHSEQDQWKTYHQKKYAQNQFQIMIEKHRQNVEKRCFIEKIKKKKQQLQTKFYNTIFKKQQPQNRLSLNDLQNLPPYDFIELCSQLQEMSLHHKKQVFAERFQKYKKNQNYCAKQHKRNTDIGKHRESIDYGQFLEVMAKFREVLQRKFHNLRNGVINCKTLMTLLDSKIEEIKKIEEMTATIKYYEEQEAAIKQEQSIQKIPNDISIILKSIIQYSIGQAKKCLSHLNLQVDRINAQMMSNEWKQSQFLNKQLNLFNSAQNSHPIFLTNKKIFMMRCGTLLDHFIKTLQQHLEQQIYECLKLNVFEQNINYYISLGHQLTGSININLLQIKYHFQSVSLRSQTQSFIVDFNCAFTAMENCSQQLRAKLHQLNLQLFQSFNSFLELLSFMHHPILSLKTFKLQSSSSQHHQKLNSTTSEIVGVRNGKVLRVS